jgi:DNA excision repair protein ERCC-1
VQVAAVFLSLKFHRLKPQYIHQRIAALQRAFRLFVLCHCDVDDPVNPLADVTQACIDLNCTLLVAFSDVEAARYLELLKVYENKGLDALKPRVDSDYTARCEPILPLQWHEVNCALWRMHSSSVHAVFEGR